MTTGRRRSLVLGFVFLLGARLASAETYDRRWPAVPADPSAPLGELVMERLTAFAVAFERELDVLTIDLVSLRIDPRGRGCKLRIGGGDRRLALAVAGDVRVVDGTAQIKARLDVELAGRRAQLVLPRFEMAATSYRGERGVELRLPLIRRAF